MKAPFGRLAFILCVQLLLLPGSLSARFADPDFDRIDAYLLEKIRELEIPGASLAIVRDTQVVHIHGVGVTGPSGERVIPQTPFLIASLTKSFTALAILQLVEENKVDLDSTVDEYLPWFRTADAHAMKRVTIRHLLSHVSGFTTYSGREVLGSDDTSFSAIERYLRSLGRLNPNPPGEAYRYSNVNYILLGAIIEAASGMAYEERIERRIFEPLDMGKSFTSREKARAYGMAAEHRYWFRNPVPAGGLPVSRATMAASQLISSSEDLGHYLIAFLNEGSYGGRRILSAGGVELLLTPAIEWMPGRQYAMGWQIAEEHGEKFIYHGGDAIGHRAYMAMFPGRNMGMVLLLNSNSHDFDMRPRVDALIANIRRMTLGQEIKPIPGSAGFPLIHLVLLIAAQLLEAVLSILFLKRRRNTPHSRPIGAALRYMLVGIPLAFHLGLSFFLLLLVPWRFESPLSVLILHVPDSGWMIVLSGLFALVWGLLRAAWAFRALRL